MEYLPILMTASVSTNGMKDAYFSDEEREKMYVETLIFYINNILNDAHYKIVFAENSGWDIQSLIRQLPSFDSSRLEFISLNKDDFDISKGKGYNELLMMNQALDKSTILMNSKGFVKVTGRYPIYNLKHYVEASTRYLQKGNVLYCDVKDHSIYKMLGLDWNSHSFYAVLYAVDKAFYQSEIAPHYVELNDYAGYLVEDMLFDLVKSEYCKGRNKSKGTVGGGKLKVRFDVEPVCGGLQGSKMDAWSFSVDQNNLKSKFKRLLGNSFRLLLPWIWF